MSNKTLFIRKICFIIGSFIFSIVLIALSISDILELADKLTAHAVSIGKKETGQAAHNAWLMCKLYHGSIPTPAKTPKVNPALRQAISSISLGKTGYVAVIGADGDEDSKSSNLGKYIICLKGQCDGINVLETKDPKGRKIIREMIKQAKSSGNGKVTSYEYMWKNPSEKYARNKICSIVYFKPFGWLIIASTYEDDFIEEVSPIASNILMIFYFIVSAVIVLLWCIYTIIFKLAPLIERLRQDSHKD